MERSASPRSIRLARVAASEQRRQRSDSDLEQRALALSREHLGGRAVPASVRWVSNQNSRWGSCTPAEGSIRLSDKLRGMPSWVVDYVLVHELAHLLVPGHGDDFWQLVRRYPRTERAIGYLEGLSAAAMWGVTGLGEDTDEAACSDQGALERT